MNAMPKPEDAARETIDAALEQAGWAVQDADKANLHGSRGSRWRVPVEEGPRFADYLLYVEGRPPGSSRRRRRGRPSPGSRRRPPSIARGSRTPSRRTSGPCRFFTRAPASRRGLPTGSTPSRGAGAVFHFHSPETLAVWLARRASRTYPPKRLRDMPPIVEQGLWPAQIRAVRDLEESFALDKPRALIQMATGSGKTFTAVTASTASSSSPTSPAYSSSSTGKPRPADAKEFQQYVTPDDGASSPSFTTSST